jgi:hypothetical protein
VGVLFVSAMVLFFISALYHRRKWGLASEVGG